MNVYTYYVGHSHEEELLELWKNSWRRVGWQPIVLTEKDAEHHPLFSFFKTAKFFHRSPNPEIYERACWIRWLALSYISDNNKFCHSDFDVINYGWMPGDDCIPGEYFWNGASMLTGVEAKKIVQLIQHEATNWGMAHYGDQTLFNRMAERERERLNTPMLKPAPLVHYNEVADWHKAKLVHYTNHHCSKHPYFKSGRVAVINAVRKPA